MPLTDAATVKRAGQLRYELFEGLNSEGDLNALINDLIEVQDAWLYSRLGDTYATTDTRLKTRFKWGEAYLVLAQLTAMAKARKAYGTHFSFDSEDSQSYDNPVGTEWRELAMELLDEFVQVDTGGKGFAMPVFIVSNAPDLSQLESEGFELGELLDEARDQTNREVITVTN